MNLRRHSFVVRYLTLFGGEAFSKLCVFAAFAYLARTFGPQKFGIIELALTVMVFCTLGAESGLGSYGARKIEQSPELIPEIIPRIITLRALLSLPAYALILLLSIRYGNLGVGVLLMYGFVVLLTPLFTQWVFQGLRQMQWVAAGSALRYSIFSVLVFALVRPQSDPRVVAFAEVCGAGALVTLNIVLLHRVLKMRLKWTGAIRGALSLFRETWFLGASDLTWATMWYSPTLIIGWMAWWAHAQQIAWLAAAVRIVMALHTFVWLYFFNLMPNLSKELHHSVDAWRSLVHRSLSASIWIPCLIGLGGTVFAPLAISIVYGRGFEDAVVPLQIIIWMIPVVWLSGHFRYSLVAGGHQHLDFVASAVAAVVTVLLALIGIRLYGAIGGAVSLLAGGITNGVLAAVFSYRVIGPVRLRMAALPIGACIVAALSGFVVSTFVDRLAGALVAIAFYGVSAASQWNVSRLKLAWEGRLE